MGEAVINMPCLSTITPSSHIAQRPRTASTDQGYGPNKAVDKDGCGGPRSTTWRNRDYRIPRDLHSRRLEAALPAGDPADRVELRDRHPRRVGGRGDIASCSATGRAWHTIMTKGSMRRLPASTAWETVLTSTGCGTQANGGGLSMRCESSERTASCTRSAPCAQPDAGAAFVLDMATATAVMSEGKGRHFLLLVTTETGLSQSWYFRWRLGHALIIDVRTHTPELAFQGG